jgi:hypothetical protein
MPNPSSDRAIAIVGVGAILPDALSAPAFWQNIVNKRYCISETPADRWSIADYYDPDPSRADKSYSKIGGWVQGFQFDWKKYRIPPKVAAAMDEGQQWAVTIADEALADYGYPEPPARHRTHRRDPGHGDGRRAALHHAEPHRFPEFAGRTGAAPSLPTAAAVREAILGSGTSASTPSCRRSPRTPCRASFPTSSPGAWPMCSTCAAPTSSPTRRAPPRFAAINAPFEMLTSITSMR